MSSKAVTRTFLCITMILGLSRCPVEVILICTYTPQGQNFAICFDVTEDDKAVAETACSQLSSELREEEEGCTSVDVQGYCTKGNIDAQLEALSEQPAGLTDLAFYMYGTDVAQNESFCTGSLGGTYRSKD